MIGGGGFLREPKVSSRLQAAGAGAAAATVWGLLEQVDQRLLRCDYSDIAVLGKAVTRGPHWRLTGFASARGQRRPLGLALDDSVAGDGRTRAGLP